MVGDCDAKAFPVISIDYGYLCKPSDEEKATPLLCGRDTGQRWYYAIPTPSKGVGDGWAPQAEAMSIAQSGHKKTS